MSAYHREIKPWEELTIIDDYMFKLVMRHKRFCKRLIEKILNIKIRDITYLEEEKSLKMKYDSKGIRLDVYVEGDDTIYDIEMQVRDYGDQELAQRTRYYQSMIDVDSLARGALYKELRSSIIIFLCPFELFEQNRHIYTFRNLCIEDKNLELNDGTTKIFLSSKGTANDVSPDIKAFLDYMNGLPAADDFIKEIDACITKTKTNHEERVSYMTYEMKMREAHDDGRAEGRAEGREEMASNLAIAMLRDGKPIEEIIKYSHLSEARIQELAKQL
ncbi:Rpn family recombination-promoting nuclease/putative transposase [Selenomonas ruminis]|uniref:Rpn family recombination-promoting nuclease/putative transposase n=1 Tax=Selenomonas ruminis TaxID=2593411 RepID=A0A5D6W7U7_9FIRM|nr:Rpn family recombination-promoting nuclease/putative transposase [Selenomonas sp. mPRGC5]TYZ24521.1 Rpn family recombination-promoting nuclease/putative transposase [Selenomonas sp. mPRGC5]